MLGFFSGLYMGKKHGVPFLGTEETEWAIGIYTGSSPFDLHADPAVKNPVLDASHVTDVSAAFVADPFLIQYENTWFMFFEVYNRATEKGDIAVASSENGLNWVYQKVVLSEEFHLSYPYVFAWKGEYYMIPETFQANSIRLYKATNFPYSWSLVSPIIEGSDFVDSSIFFSDEKCWIFTSTTASDALYLYYADDLLGPWQAHPDNPLIRRNPQIARPAGRVALFDGRMIRFAQDDYPVYGRAVHAFEITELTTSSYKEIEFLRKPLLAAKGGLGWNALGMHNIDLVRLSDKHWVAAVDGKGKKHVVSWRFWKGSRVTG